MSRAALFVIETSARILRANERDGVLGDLAEVGAGPLRSFCAIFGLLARQHAEHWRDWRPWLAGGVALPASLLLLGVSFGISMNSRALLEGDSAHIGFPFLFEVLLLVTWSWTSGFLIGSLSGHTLWVSALLSSIPCLSCVFRFREPSLSRICVLLFLIPGLLGVLHGRRLRHVPFTAALIIAATVTGLMLAWNEMHLCEWPLVLPAWFLVAAADKFRNRREELPSC